MGIKNLKKFIKANAPKGVILMNPYEYFKGKKIAIDLNSYLYKFVYNSNNKSKNQYLKDLNEMIISFLSNDIVPIFIFDGKPGEAKNMTLNTRKMATDQKKDKIKTAIDNLKKYIEITDDISIDELAHAINEYLLNETLSQENIEFISNNLAEITKNDKNIIKMTGEIYSNVEKLFDLWTIPYLKAQSEADFLCARLYKDGKVAAVCSEDMDLLPHGAGNLIVGINSLDLKMSGKTVLYSLDIILEELVLDMKQFIDLCILAGCDYCAGIKDIGANKGFKLLKLHGSIDNIPMKFDKDNIKIARTEFNEKWVLENYSDDDINFDSKNINKDKLIDFLLKETTYRKKTVLDKLMAAKV